ncbi:unnamed protein product [Bathycoccus prasinos]
MMTTTATRAQTTPWKQQQQQRPRFLTSRASVSFSSSSSSLLSKSSSSKGGGRQQPRRGHRRRRSLPSEDAKTGRGVVVAGRFPDERTYIMIKPDGVQRGKVGAIVERFENKGMQLKGLKTFQCTRAIAEEHYRDLSSKPFFKDLVDYIISGPVVCMIWQGPTGTVAAARKMIGETNPLESLPGSIRGDYAVEVGRNIIHGSDSVDSAEREINLWFADGNGVVDWQMTNNGWIRE